MELTALEAINKYHRYYKPAKSVKYGIEWDYFRALKRAINYVLESSTPHMIYDFVEHSFCPKLNKQEEDALSLLEKRWKEETGCLNNIYRPITYKPLNELLLFVKTTCEMKGELLEAYNLLEKHSSSKEMMKDVNKIIFFANGRLSSYELLFIAKELKVSLIFCDAYIFSEINKTN